jgi:hypothetical protein
MKLEEVVHKILEARVLLKEYENDPDALSKLAVRISTYNAYLGDYASEIALEASRKRSEAYRKYRDEGYKPTPAENEAKNDVRELETEADARNKMHKDAANLVSVIQTRLRVLENQLKNEI